MTKSSPWKVLLVAHGTVEKLEDLPDFLLEIRRGRPASEELVAEVERRYRLVGGSPLLEGTRRQAAALGARLGLEARVAMRLWRPRVAEVLSDLNSEHRVCLVPMAPFSVPVYESAARAELTDAGLGVELCCVEPWGQQPAVIEAWARGILEALPVDREGCEVILSAHSLPQRVIDSGDPYADQFERAARMVAQRLPVVARTAYQSQGAAAGAWLGPSLEEQMRSAQARGVRHLVVAPIGFLTEHIETLYDLDIEARDLAQELGLRWTRVPTLEASSGLIEGLATAVQVATEVDRGASLRHLRDRD